MNKKIVSLLSVMSVMFAGAAMAATVDGGPTDINDANYSGYYKNDTEYTGAATETNLGARYATDNSEYDLETEWTADKFQIAAGQYLASGATTGAACPAGSFCIGSTGDGFTFSATENQGIESCPTGFTNSATGATGIGECYRACTTDDIEHSTSVTGNVYQNGKTTCDPVCAGGWHKEVGLNLLETFIPDNLSTVHVSNNGVKQTGHGDPMDYIFQLDRDDRNAWAVSNSSAIGLRGMAMCSPRGGSANEVVDGDLPLGGQGNNCYCKLTHYYQSGRFTNLSSSWVLFGSISNCDVCSTQCADYGFYYSSEFRSAVLGAATATAASCSANRYKLKWQDAAGNVTETTNTVHGGSIIAPSTAPTKTGHTFRGWKLKKSAN